MKFTTTLFALFTGSALADQTCTTQYASTSVSKVPTRTKTITATSTQTFVLNDATEYSSTTTTISFTYLTVRGKETITIPTGEGFTPIISAPTRKPTGPHPPAYHKHNRNAAAASYSSSTPSTTPSLSSPPTRFPKSVDCTTIPTTSTLSTTLYQTYTTTKTLTSTLEFHSSTLVPTKTLYEACETPARNLISRLHGYPIDTVKALIHSDLCDPRDGVAAQIACANPKQCCEAVQARGNTTGDSGFAWIRNATGRWGESSTGRVCAGMSLWTFDTAAKGKGKGGKGREGRWWIGNGEQGSGIFGEVV